MDDECPDCGRPLERIDDFWYCDNPDCPRRAAPIRRPEPSAADGKGGPRPEAERKRP